MVVLARCCAFSSGARQRTQGLRGEEVVVVGMVKLMRVLSVVNPLVLAASAVMWMSKGAHMMARIARHDGDSVPRVS